MSHQSSTESITQTKKELYDHWERSNHLSMMLIKSHSGKSIRGFISGYTKVKDYLKAIEEQFETSNKALGSTLITKMCSIKFTSTKGMCEHIMKMRYSSTTQIFGD